MSQNHSDPDSNSLKFLLRPLVRSLRRTFLDFRNWKLADYAAPSPKAVKDRVLRRNAFPDGTWVETGTFLGETTTLLADWGRAVYSLEPARELYERAHRKFAQKPHVQIINAPSEKEFPSLLPKLAGPVNFWLDGHFSAGPTYRGEYDTPVLAELNAIGANLSTLSPVAILIDDVRCFDPSIPDYNSYPKLDELVDWARQHNLRWHIEHDILVIKSK